MKIRQDDINSFTITDLTLGKLLAIENALQSLQEAKGLTTVQSDVLTVIKYQTNLAMK